MRERVFGIETEYALIYHPARGERVRPTNLQLYALFERALAEQVRSLPRALSLLRAKTGRFLENGMSFHYEATPEHYEHGLLEVASPECRDPYTLLRYERAKDDLVEELSREVNRRLGFAGFRGEVRVGKNNVDSLGHTFGSHESYWVEDPLPWRRRLAVLLAWLPLWVVTLPVLTWTLLLTPLLLVLLLTLVLLYGLAMASGAGFRTLLGRLKPRWARRLGGWLSDLHRRVVTRANALATHPGEAVRRLHWLLAPLFPLLELHSLLLRHFAVARIQRDFTAFLVTRTVFTGAGCIAFDGGPLVRLAQRPPFLQAVARIFTFGDGRPIYEIRDLFFQPWSLFASRRRLHLMIGDANLCDWAQVLRMGTSALVLEAIESGAELDWPVLADPLEALRTTSRDPSLCASLRLADGSRATPLEVQRRYLEGVRRVVSGSRGWKARVLRDWHTTLELLATDPAALADRVDWIAKLRLLHAEVPDPRDRDALRVRGAALVRGSPPHDPEAKRLRELAFRARRVDLRYHELGPRGGHRRLVRRGEVRRLAADAEVAGARLQPPPDTRARPRGGAIREAALRGLPGAATWHRVRIGAFDWRWFPDPLAPGGA